MTVTGFLSTLSAKRMSSVDNYYAPGNLPGRLNSSNLPALLLIFDDAYFDAARSESVDQESYWYRVVMRHLLLIQFEGSGVHGRRFADFSSMLDMYRDMLTADLYMSGNLSRPLQIMQTQVGIQNWEGDLFVGIDFRLQAYVA